MNYKALSQLSQHISFLFPYLNSAQNNLVIELCRALKMKMKVKLVDIIDVSLLVYSNEMVSRKRGRLGLDPVKYPFSFRGGESLSS